MPSLFEISMHCMLFSPQSEMTESRQGRSSSTGDEEESLAILRRHVMNELLDTERVYVEELLCVLEVSLQLGGQLGVGHGLGSPHPLWSCVHQKACE